MQLTWPLTTPSAKAGARHSAQDYKAIQTILDESKRLGAGRKGLWSKAGKDSPYAGVGEALGRMHEAAKALGAVDPDDMTDQAKKAIPVDRLSSAIRYAASCMLEKLYQLLNSGYGWDYPEIHVYPSYVIVAIGIRYFRADYAIDETQGLIAFVPPEQWAPVIQEWRDATQPEQVLTTPDDARKAVQLLDEDARRIGSYAVLWGGPEAPDLSLARDWFDAETDFWLEGWNERPMVYDHATNTTMKSHPVVGIWDTYKKDDVGLWVEGVLDERHTYLQGLLKLIKMKALNLSSDTIAHLMRREKAAKATHRVVTWPLACISLTPCPAEPRMIQYSTMKALYADAALALPETLVTTLHDLGVAEKSGLSAAATPLDVPTWTRLLDQYATL